MSTDYVDDNAYASLAAAHGGEQRWAFGTGFDDPLAGIGDALPPGVDATAVAATCCALGDDALVLAQRLAGWCARAPELEDEMALANIALDLLGQARLLLTRAARLDPALRPETAPEHVPDEDALAYFRAPHGFHNVVLAELDDGADFAVAITRLLAFALWRLELLRSEADVPADPVLRAIARRAVIELAYHRDYAAGWAVRLGDGTVESHHRMQAAVDRLWPWLGELAEQTPTLWPAVASQLDDVLRTATLVVPAAPAAVEMRGRAGEHTGELTQLLADLQAVARADDDASW
jgi:ring-1,2-phenylacetyl-CoA epoxidase subunit PaaC